MNEVLLRAKGLGVKCSNRWLIKNVAISLEAGQIITVIGPNGAGKSTLVRQLTELNKA